MPLNYSPSHANGLTSEGAVTQDRLYDRETITKKVTIAAAAPALVRGHVLGKITASGKFTVSASAAGDGSEVPDVILLHDVPDSASDQDAIVAIKGRFNEGALTLGTGHTLASIRETLRDKNIYLETVIG